MSVKQNRTLHFEELGLMDYEDAHSYQDQLMQQIIAMKLANRVKTDEEREETPNYLLFVEHPHVYTIGKSGDGANMLADSQKLKEIGATFVQTNRGGDITY